MHADVQVLDIKVGREISRSSIRDTAQYRPVMRCTDEGMKPRKLKHMALDELGATIQDGEHRPDDDARAALYIYHKHQSAWERSVNGSTGGRIPAFCF